MEGEVEGESGGGEWRGLVEGEVEGESGGEWRGSVYI